MKESHEMKFNILILGIPEISGSVWEKRVKLLQHFHKFMKDGLFISDSTLISPVDYHRLLQQRIFKLCKIARPIIIKLTNVANKQKNI